MPTITRTQVRQEMLRRAPILGRALTADSLAKSPPTLTDVSEYQRQRAGNTSYEAQYINRYALSDPDQWRLITTIDPATGIVSVDGPAYTDNTTLTYERLNLHPDDLNMAIAEGQRRQRVKTNIALVRGHDLDMQMTGTNYWGTAVALGNSALLGATLAKSTTEVFSGTQSLGFTASALPNYTRSEYIRVGTGRNIYAAAIVKVDVNSGGGVNMKLYMPGTGTYLGSTVTWPGAGEWVLMFIQATMPADTSIVQIEFSGTTANTIFQVDTCFGPYQSGQTEYDLQSQMDEAYKIRFVRPATFPAATGVSGVAYADSLSYLGDLIRPEDWDIEAFRRDVHFNRLRFQANSYNNRNIGWGFPNGGTFMQQSMRPIWLAMEAQVSDFEPLLTEASTTNQPLDECACYSLRWLAETETQRDPSNPVWQNMLQEYKMWSVIEDMGRPPQAMYTPQRYHHTLA